MSSISKRVVVLVVSETRLLKLRVRTDYTRNTYLNSEVQQLSNTFAICLKIAKEQYEKSLYWRGILFIRNPYMYDVRTCKIIKGYDIN